MDFLKKFWPLSFNRKEVKDLVIAVVVYLVAPTVLSIVCGLLGKIPVVGLVFRIIGYFLYLADLYCTAGCVFAFLNFFKVGPFKD